LIAGQFVFDSINNVAKCANIKTAQQSIIYRYVNNNLNLMQTFPTPVMRLNACFLLHNVAAVS
jgi:hypothetical protein